MKKNPSSYLYWNDLENDEKLRTCAWDVKGFWACKLLPIAARSPEYGVILIGNHPCVWNDDLPTVLAMEAGASEPDLIEAVAAKFLAFLTALVKSDAASVDGAGRLFNRRMVREEQDRKHIHDVRSFAGKRSAEARKAISTNGQQKLNKDPNKRATKPEDATHGNTTINRKMAEKTTQQTASKIQLSSILHYYNANVTTMVPHSAPRIEACKKLVFDVGLPWFMTNTGCTESMSRKFLGLKLRDHGEEALADTLVRAEKAAPVDPRSWITRNIVTGGRANGHRPTTHGTSQDQTRVQHEGESASSAGIAAALHRRSVPTGR